MSKVAKNSAAMMFARAWYMGLRFILTPFVIMSLGLEMYGYWCIVFVIFMYLGLNRVGLTMTYVTFTARYKAAGRLDRVEAVLRTGCTMMAVLSVFVFALTVLFGDYALQFLNVPAASMDEARTCLWIAMAATLISYTWGIYEGALDGLQEMFRVRMTQSVVATIEAGLIIATVTLNWGVIGMAAAYTLQLLLPIPLYRHWAKRFLPGVKFGPGRIDKQAFKEMMKFGGGMQLLSTILLVTASLDRIVLSRVASLWATGMYEAGRKLVQFAIALPTAASGALIPAVAELDCTKDGGAAARRLTLKALRSIANILVPALALLVAISLPLSRFWLGEGFDLVPAILAIVAVGAFVHTMTAPLTAMTRGQGKTKQELIYASVWFVACLTLTWSLGRYGILGVATGSVLAQIIAALVLYRLCLTSIGLSARETIQSMSAPLLICVPIGAVVHGLTWLVEVDGRWTNGAVAAVFGMVSMGLMGVGLWKYSLDASERKVVSRMAGGLVRRLRKSKADDDTPQDQSQDGEPGEGQPEVSVAA